MRPRALLPLIALVAVAAPADALAQEGDKLGSEVVEVGVEPAPQANLADISDEVMCTVCGVPLELALEAPQAEAQRDFIRELIAEGRTKDEIKDALVAEYGEAVLAVPGDNGFGLLAWLIPIAAFVTAAAAIGIALRRWRHTSGSAEPQPAGNETPDAEAAERLDADMARYDL